MADCPYHEAHEKAIQRNERDIQKLFELDAKTSDRIDKVEETFGAKIDNMKNMVIAGLAGTALQLVLLIIGLIFAYLQNKGS